MDDRVKKVCGSCRYWQPHSDFHVTGICKLNKAKYRIHDRENCIGWKIADPWDLDKREIIENEYDMGIRKGDASSGDVEDT